MTALDTKALEAGARVEAEWDGRTFNALGRIDKERYLSRLGAAIRAYLSALSPSQGEGPAADVVEALRQIKKASGLDEVVGGAPAAAMSRFADIHQIADSTLASLAPRAAKEAPADEQSGETSHVADDGQPDETQEWRDYDPDC